MSSYQGGIAMEKMIWWEKTVEYFFVQRYVDLEMIISPLDGNHERAGDALLSRADQWLIIEFKRDKDALSSEQGKFNDWYQASAKLGNRDRHHFLVFGAYDENLGFHLCNQTYFSRKDASMDMLLQSGTDVIAFSEYLTSLVALKKQAEGASTGGFSYVAGISTTRKKVTQCLTLGEFSLALGLERKLQLEIEPKPARSKSFGLG